MNAVANESSTTDKPLLELRDHVLRIAYGVAIAFAPVAYFSKEIYVLTDEPLMRLMPAGTSMIAT